MLIGSVEEGFTYNSILELSKIVELHVFCSRKIKLKYMAKTVNYHLFKNTIFSISLFESIELLFQVLVDLLRAKDLFYLSRFRYNYNLLRNAHYKSKFLLSELDSLNINSDNTRFLSFWMDDNAILLALLKKRRLINNAFSLAHGRDLFEWREPEFGLLPFKKFQLKYLDKVFSVSINGANYLKKRFVRFSNKIDVFYLGSYDYGVSIYEATDFTIVSCADIKSIKRVDLIAEALSLTREKINWIHVGNINYGNTDIAKIKLKEKLNLLKRNKNVKFNFKGSIDNKSFMEVYTNNMVNLFVNVSTTEGLPFSMIEASSFGVPIISTNAGGCSEIVDNFGVILPVNLSATDLCNEIQKFRNSHKNTSANRRRIKDNWNIKFNIEKNVRELIENLEKP